MRRTYTYVSKLNQATKSRTQKYVVTELYAENPALNTQYFYRTLAGAQNQMAHIQRRIESDAKRNLGAGSNREIPVTGCTLQTC